MSDNLINLDNLKPFPKFCITLGILPTSFRVTYTYEEQVLECMRYIRDEIIPTLNNTVLATEELQQKYIELVEYVNNYFENLDVQEEINNKLDEMAESGDLADIIAEYLQVVGLICFNTKSNMVAAENLADGSFVKTYGTTTYNDGYGEFYKIRTLLNTDVIDDDNIVALTNYPTLIAEKMPNAYINSINNEINNLKRLTNKKYIFIGDSYNTTDTPAGGVPIVPWSNYLSSYLGLTSTDYYNSGVSGAGWVNGTSFLTQLQTLASSMTEAIKNSITDIVVLGGINDAIDADIFSAIGAFATYCETNFPNAMITIGMISWAKGETNRNNLRNKLQIYNNRSNRKNLRVIENAFTFFHNYLHHQPDGHPNDAGSQTIAYFIANVLKGGQTSVKWINTSAIASANNELGITAEAIGNFTEMFNGDMASITLDFNNTITINKTNMSFSGTKYKLGEINPQTIWIPTTNSPMSVLGITSCWVYDSSNHYHNCNVRLILEGNSLYGIFENAGENDFNGTIMHIARKGFTNIPAEFC